MEKLTMVVGAANIPTPRKLNQHESTPPLLQHLTEVIDLHLKVADWAKASEETLRDLLQALQIYGGWAANNSTANAIILLKEALQTCVQHSKGNRGGPSQHHQTTIEERLVGDTYRRG
eukprot:c29134_g2_i3 orf=519-872(+)